MSRVLLEISDLNDDFLFQITELLYKDSRFAQADADRAGILLLFLTRAHTHTHICLMSVKINITIQMVFESS